MKVITSFVLGVAVMLVALPLVVVFLFLCLLLDIYDWSVGVFTDD